MNCFPRFEDNSTRKVCNLLVPRYSLLCHYHMQLLHLENIFFWNWREFVSLYHGLVDTVRLPLVREHQSGIPKTHSCSQSNSNDRHPLASLVQPNPKGRRQPCMFFLSVSSSATQGGAKLQMRINTLYNFAAQGSVIGGWSTDIHSSQDENYHEQMYYASQILVSHLRQAMLAHLFYAFNKWFIYQILGKKVSLGVQVENWLLLC